MNSLQRNSATLYNKSKKDNLIKKELIMRQEHERYQEKLKKMKLKKWQNPDYQEQLRLKREEENKPKEESRIKKEEIIVNKIENKIENKIVNYNPHQNKHLNEVQQRMVYIQYLLNTFEMYPEFDIHYYRNNNEDIKHLSNYELVYHWNHIGINEKDKRIYNHETFMVSNPNIYKEYPIYIFMHVCNLHNGIQIFNDQLKSIIDSGLYDKCKNILVCIVGKSFDLPIAKYNKLILLYQDDNPKYYEVKTINYIKYIADKISDNSRILYVHTKGVRKNGDEICVRSWRKLLEYYTIVNHDIALQYLMNNYDTIGSNVINMSPSTSDRDKYLYAVNPNHYFHYSGNFWWSTVKHIRRLPMLKHDPFKHATSTRCRAENWILSALPNMRGFEMYYNKNYVHPYNTYCDPNGYQKKYMEVFTGRNNFSSLLDL